MQATKTRGTLVGFGLFLFTSACVMEPSQLAPLVAQPDTQPARNFTSFSGALRCMDAMLASSDNSRILISSSDIPDRTKKISVGADDMLINAIGHMNRTSKKYVFLDQALVKDGGLIDLRVAAKRPTRPEFYIRGSISQLDSNTMHDEGGLELNKPNGTGLLDAGVRRGRTVSVVSVDLHLVRFPTRQVVPGLSVANSMTVISRGSGVDARGVINLSRLNLWLEVDRVESQSQAVRNLIELGVIELLGRHSGLPYWQCLSTEQTDTQSTEREERQYHRESHPGQVTEVQELMQTLRLYMGPIDGVPTTETRSAIAQFQDAEGLIASGHVDFDLLTLLRKRVAQIASDGTVNPTTSTSASSIDPDPTDDGYQNIYHFLR